MLPAFRRFPPHLAQDEHYLDGLSSSFFPSPNVISTEEPGTPCYVRRPSAEVVQPYLPIVAWIPLPDVAIAVEVRLRQAFGRVLDLRCTPFACPFAPTVR